MFNLQSLIARTKELLRFGEIVAGSDNEFKLVEYLRDQFERLDLDVDLQRVEVLTWIDRGSSLEVYVPGRQHIDIPAAAIPYSPQGDLEAPLVYGGTCLKGELDGLDIEGKLVLVEWFKDELDDVKYQYLKAVERGAVGVVVYDAYLGRLLRRIVITGTKDYRFTAAPPPPVPVISITREDGLFLKKLLEHEELKARLIVETEVRQGSTGYNVSITFNGKREEEIIVGTHHDRWFTAVVDNTIGVAMLIELANALKKRPPPLRTIKLISFTAEESGAPGFSPWYWIYGSRCYLKERLSNDDIDKIYAFLSVDVLGTGRPIISVAGYELQALAERLTQDVNAEYEPLTSYSDCYSFGLHGIPSLCIHTIPSYLKYYHTNEDSLEKVDLKLLQDASHILSRLLDALAYQGQSLDYLYYLQVIRRKLRELKANVLDFQLKTLINYLKNAKEHDIRKAFKVINQAFYLPCLLGYYEELHKPFITIFLPQLEILHDIKSLKRALIYVKKGDIEEAKKTLCKIPPVRIVPGFEILLPSINVRPLIRLLNEKSIKNEHLLKLIRLFLSVAEMEGRDSISSLEELFKIVIDILKGICDVRISRFRYVGTLTWALNMEYTL